MTTPTSFSAEPHQQSEPEEREHRSTDEAPEDDVPEVDVAVPRHTIRSGPPCRCGHGPDEHRHYRSGRDCGVCGAARCDRYRPQTRWRWWLRRYRGSP